MAHNSVEREEYGKRHHPATHLKLVPRSPYLGSPSPSLFLSLPPRHSLLRARASLNGCSPSAGSWPTAGAVVTRMEAPARRGEARSTSRGDARSTMDRCGRGDDLTHTPPAGHTGRGMAGAWKHFAPHTTSLQNTHTHICILQGQNRNNVFETIQIIPNRN